MTTNRAYLTHNEDEGICALNTPRQGALTDISYNQLCLAFGENMWVDGPDKVDWEWIVEFPCGTVASIYNYKDGPNYCGSEGLNRYQVTTWNVGGSSAEAYHLVMAALEGGAA
tara:strand:+ start:1627 stop:1965 length:339 start_codon:yes stop_codon:yes gene_type:complete